MFYTICMRVLDVGILAETMTNLTYSRFNSHLALYESKFLHGWHTTFYFKCVSCHQLFSEFPSSKPLKTDTTKDIIINVNLPSVHCSDSLGGTSKNSRLSTICQLPSKKCHLITSTRLRKSPNQQPKYPCKLHLMCSIKKPIIHLQQFPAVSISQSALTVHGRLEDSTPTWDLDLRFMYSQSKFLNMSF